MQFSDLSLLELTLAALGGGGVGFLSGVFGVGGGFLLVPVLNIVLKIPMELAVGSGACQVLGPATTSILARRINREHWRLPLTIAGGLFVGVFSGARLLQSAKQHGNVTVLQRTIPLAELTVLTVYFVLLTLLGCFALWEVHRYRQGRELKKGWLASWRIPPCVEFPALNHRILSITTLSFFGLIVGFLAGLLGMSGGLILLPGLIYLLGLRTHTSILSSLVIVWIVAAQSTVAHAWLGNIDISLVIALLLGGTFGARLGSELGIKLGGRQLRHGFGWLLLLTALLIAGRLSKLLLF